MASWRALYPPPPPRGRGRVRVAGGAAAVRRGARGGRARGVLPARRAVPHVVGSGFCGLGSLVVALNALAIQSGPAVEGPVALVLRGAARLLRLARRDSRRGSTRRVACLARCNGADVELPRRRDDLADCAPHWRGRARRMRRDRVLRPRRALDQTGTGHFSPIGGYHAGARLASCSTSRASSIRRTGSGRAVLSGDAARDPRPARPRGWMVLRPRASGVALGFSLRCDGESWQGLARRLTSVARDLEAAVDSGSLARAVEPLMSHLELRTPSAPAHRDALASARAALRGVAGYPLIAEAVGPEHGEGVTLLLLAMAELLSPEQRSALGALSGVQSEDPPFAAELASLRAQLTALGTMATPASAPGR